MSRRKHRNDEIAPAEDDNLLTPVPSPADLPQVSSSSSLFNSLVPFLNSHTRLTGWLVLIFSLLLFCSNRGHFFSSDQRGTTMLAWWWANGNPPHLTNAPDFPDTEAKIGYWAIRTDDGLMASIYPPGISALAMPCYWILKKVGFDLNLDKSTIQGKFFAALMTAVVCWAAWLALLRMAGPIAALAGAICLAAGSPLYSIISQGLWTQTGALFCQAMSIALGIEWLLPRRSEGAQSASRIATWLRAIFAGFFALWAWECRPPFVLWTALFAALAIVRLRLRAWPVFIGIAAAFACAIALNISATGKPFGIYSEKVSDVGFQLNIPKNFEALFGLLFSPSRGLLFFCPWAIVIIAGFVLFVVRHSWKNSWLAANALFALAIIGMLVFFGQWGGGWSNGPRLQADLLLSAVIVAAPALQWAISRLWTSAIFVVLLLPAVFIQHRSAHMVTRPWESVFAQPVADYWSWRKSCWLYNATHGRTECTIHDEARDPLLTESVLVPSMADVQKFFESGLKVTESQRLIQATARDSNLLFQLPANQAADTSRKQAPGAIGIAIRDNASWGTPRRLEVLLNNQRLGTIEYMSGSGPAQTAFVYDAALLNSSGRPNRLGLREERPPVGRWGDLLMGYESIAIFPPGKPLQKPLEEILHKPVNATVDPPFAKK